MTIILDLLAQGMGFGFQAAVSPGAFQALIVTETLTYGWRRGLPIIFAPLISDIPIVTITLLILGQLPDSILRLIQVAGGLFILFLAWGLFNQIRQNQITAAIQADAPPATAWEALRKGVILNLFNPAPYLFWGTVYGPIVRRTWTTSPQAAIAFVIGFYTVMVGGSAILVLVFHQARQLDLRVVRGMLIVGLVIMVILGVVVLMSGLAV